MLMQSAVLHHILANSVQRALANLTEDYSAGSGISSGGNLAEGAARNDFFLRRLTARACTRRIRQAEIWAKSMRVAGVTTKVRTVANPRPKTIAVERWIHHWVDGAPIIT